MLLGLLVLAAASSRVHKNLAQPAKWHTACCLRSFFFQYPIYWKLYHHWCNNLLCSDPSHTPCQTALKEAVGSHFPATTGDLSVLVKVWAFSLCNTNRRLFMSAIIFTVISDCLWDNKIKVYFLLCKRRCNSLLLVVLISLQFLLLSIF